MNLSASGPGTIIASKEVSCFQSPLAEIRRMEYRLLLSQLWSLQTLIKSAFCPGAATCLQYRRRTRSPFVQQRLEDPGSAGCVRLHTGDGGHRFKGPR